MSVNGKTGALIGLSIVITILLAFSISVTFNWITTNNYNQQLIIKTQQLEQQVQDSTDKLIQKSSNITSLLGDYESNKVTRSLRAAMDAYTNEDNLKDLCSIWGTKESNSNLTQIWKNTWDSECLSQGQPAPQPTPTPVPTPVPPKPNATNGTVPTPTPVPPTPTCREGEIYNATVNECVAKPDGQPAPVPTPTGALKVAVVGDIDNTGAGTSVYNQIKKQNPDMVFVLGDLGYDTDIKWFKSTYGTMGDKVFCILGNHDADNEDGSAAIEKEALQYCGNSYWVKKGATMFLMLNSNDDDLKAVITNTGKILTNQTIMQGVKTLHIMSHKPCAVPPNMHHPVEAEVKLVCDAIKTKIPAGVKVFYDQAHNHVMSESNDKTYKQIGSGGRSHYTCGTSTEFPFCNNVNYGFLIYTIEPTGMTTSQFIDYNGRVIH